MVGVGWAVEAGMKNMGHSGRDGLFEQAVDGMGVKMEVFCYTD